MTKWSWESENSSINHPRGTSRMSSLKIPTPGMTATAARSCTSCTAGAGNSPPAGTSSPYAVRSYQQLQGSRRLPHINDGEAPPSPSGHPTAPTTWQGLAYCHSSPPCHRQHVAQRHQPCCVQAAANPGVPSGTLTPILRSGPIASVSPWEHHTPGYIRD
jgi:hypothetical protein